MWNLPTSFLAVTTLALSTVACVSDTDVATPDDLEQARVRHYRIAKVELPTLSMRARELAFDLGNDDSPDNQLGMVHTTMLTVSPTYQVMPRIEAALAADLGWSLTVYDDPATGRLYGAHLARATITNVGIEPELSNLEPAFANLDDPSLPLAGDMGRIPLGTLSDALGGSDAGWIDVRRLRIDIEQIDDTRLSARVGMAIAKPDVDAEVIPNMARYFTSRLAANDSEFAAEADTNDDGIVSPAEMSAHDVTRALLAADLYDLPEFEGGQALSLGFGITAAR